MIRVDDADLVRQVAALRRAEPEMVKALRRGMREAGNSARDDVRAAARVTRSRRIPRAVKVATRITASVVSVTLRVDRKVAPHAAVMEGSRTGRPVRHPVFAPGPRSGWTWVAQRPRPYFYSTARRAAPRIQRHVFGLVGDAVRRAVRGRR